jgi:hypothetical protein
VEKLVLVGLRKDVEAAGKRLHREGLPCGLCSDARDADAVRQATELVFVVSKSNAVASSLIPILEAVERTPSAATRWLWSIDGAAVHPVHRQITGLPAWPRAAALRPAES